jgi:hypothetical protein
MLRLTVVPSTIYSTLCSLRVRDGEDELDAMDLRSALTAEFEVGDKVVLVLESETKDEAVR